MKLIRSGGTNGHILQDDPTYDKYGFGNYFMLQIKSDLDAIIGQGGVMALCTAAKPNKHHYDRRLIDMGFSVDNFTILGREDDASWERYDGVLMLGGETKELRSWLLRTGFDVTLLNNCKILGGDSAGAYVLSGKTLLDYEADGASFEIGDGFLPQLNQLIAAHVNNDYYHKPSLSDVLSKWCETNGVEYVELEEDEVLITEI